MYGPSHAIRSDYSGGLGSQQGYRVALSGLERTWYHFNSVETFILSHFHEDHYNGLLYASADPGWRSPFGIKEALFPGIPDFKEKAEFLKALFTMNLEIFGNETGIMEYDFLRAVTRINRGLRPKKRPLFKDEVVNIGGSVFEVLWPPSKLDDKRIQADVKKALKDFNEALKEDALTKTLHERVSEEGIFEEYLGKWNAEETEVQHDESEIHRQEHARELPAVVIGANESLRKAANHMSLALFEDNRFLFLGDTQSYEICQIVDYLDSLNRKNFYIFVTPHHGTVWTRRLREIEATYSLSSIGSKLCAELKPEFKDISKVPLATHANGDLEIPTMQLPNVFGWKFPWW